MKNKIREMKGFTLVELLIVIALIAILSVAVLATINPIEQSNKARDAAMKNDAAEVLAAYERYYAGQNTYPWKAIDAADSSIVLSSSQPGFGVVTASVGTTDPITGEVITVTTVGALISTSELKSSFAAKKPFVAAPNPEDMFYTYHSSTTNDNYVCYFPKAKANRDPATAGLSLKCVDTANNKIINIGSEGCVQQSSAPGSTWSYVPSNIVANVSCVPEGALN